MNDKWTLLDVARLMGRQRAVREATTTAGVGAYTVPLGAEPQGRVFPAVPPAKKKKKRKKK